MRSPEPLSVQLRRLDANEFQARSPELLAVYVAAMRYPDGTAEARAKLWVEHSRRTGFSCVIAVDDHDTVHGLAYGYRGLPGQWWHTEVRRGLLAQPAAPTAWLDDYFELTELHVRPASQGGGIGEAMLRDLLADRTEQVVLLSTPEGDNRAWKLYRRTGFADVLRRHRFSGDPRPFAVLGRRLPLDA